MKIVVFTGNAIRHRFVANELAKNVSEALVVSECSSGDFQVTKVGSLIEEHFLQRFVTEKKFFNGNDYFICKTIPIMRGEVNSKYIFETIREFRPEAMLCFGASLIREPFLSLLVPGRFVNLHLGLSPYYRGSGTNFWPFVNKELEYVGATIMHIDSCVDTGDIIVHVRPRIEMGDDVHSVGCKVIQASALRLVEIMEKLRKGEILRRVKQWKAEKIRYYRKDDFNESTLLKYNENLKNGLIENFLKSTKEDIRLVE